MSSRRFPPRHGLTHLDLLVSVALLLLLAGAALPAALRSPVEMRNRIGCAANLKQIGEGMLAYAEANAGAFPRGRHDPAAADKPIAFTAADANTPFGDNGPGPNDVTAAPFLLVRRGEAPIDAFVCHSASTLFWDFGGNGKTAADHANFPDADHLSYSFQNPYPTAKVAEAGFRWTTDLPAGFVLAADRNDGNPALLKLTANSPAADLQKFGNSDNHNRDGQNVLFADGHVDFRTTPFCGIDRDNIYTAGPSGPDAGGTAIRVAPAHPTDNVLLPATEKPGGL